VTVEKTFQPTQRTLLLASILLAALLTCGPAHAQSPGDEPEKVPWKTRAELSYVSTSGNTETSTIAAKLDLKKEGPVNRYFATGSYLRAEDSGTDTSDKLKAEGRAERVLTPRLFALLTAGYLRDRFSGYDFRAWAGPGLGADFLRTDVQSLTGLFSVLYNRDEFSRGTLARDDYPTAKATAKYEYKPRLPQFKNLTFKETLEWFTSLKETERWFVDSVTAVEARVNGHLSLGVSYTINHQNSPPSPELDRTDTTLLTSLIIDY
jgi:putative salt-induced outer membrane protein